MASQNINPTRMELKRLKARLKTAERGHKLLKDKTDEMIRQFIVLARQNKTLRMEVEQELGNALNSFMLARAMTSSDAVEEAILMPSRSVKLECSKHSIMGVVVPAIEIEETDAGEMYPYSFLSVTNELDSSIETTNKLLEKIIRLAEVEKACNMMADEIEKNKRRVNALENVMIPQMKEDIRYISMKLDEDERSSQVRLIKVKSMIVDRG